MRHVIGFAAAWVMPTHTGTEALALILRWFHIIAGITWVGLLYFFNLVNVPFMKQVDAAMKPKVFQYLTLPALNCSAGARCSRSSSVSGTGGKFTLDQTLNAWVRPA